MVLLENFFEQILIADRISIYFSTESWLVLLNAVLEESLDQRCDDLVLPYQWIEEFRETSLHS